ncbi:sugar phosphorylase [Pseudohongiella spirulinae]|uniref:Alpha-amylase n=1 Tax=Pseudohongiella spirulinae TaxID=1249552 RepID=A0A0S2KAN0_9GAMM|nr:sugar phosphorylase [Pseudohongiella spirulinae]ALO45382.1 alpha-amylase [Pseudohongiella spirulinae]
MSELKDRVCHHLAHIYHDLSDKQRDELACQLISEMRLAQSAPQPGRHPGHWSERDVYLICYADSVLPQTDQQPLQMPLEALSEFLNTWLTDCITAVHILPFFPWSSDDGFAVSDYTRVAPQFGHWGHIEQIADNFRLMADLVINHCSSEHIWFRNFSNGKDPGKDYFFTASPSDDLSQVIRPRTSELLRPTETPGGLQHVWCTFGHDQVDLNFRNPNVLLEFVRIIREYLDHKVKVFRLDAVAFIWKEAGSTCLNLPQTHEIVRLLRALLEEADPEAIIITETNIPKRENLSYFGNANEAHSIYNFSLPPLLLYTLLTGHCRHLKNWLMSMPPAQMGTFYFNFIASHDGIGLRPAEGLLSDDEIHDLLSAMERAGGRISWRATSSLTRRPYEINISLWDALSSTITHSRAGADEWHLQRFICAHAILLALEGVPAFYIHSILGTSNDYERLNQTQHNRHINRKRWPKPELDAQLANEHSNHSQVLTRLCQLIQLRQQQPAFHPNATQFTLHLGDAVFAFWRQSLQRHQSIFALNNVSDTERNISLADINLIDTEEWYDLISGTHIDLGQAILTLAPYQTVWLSNRRPDSKGTSRAISRHASVVD